MAGTNPPTAEGSSSEIIGFLNRWGVIMVILAGLSFFLNCY
jgi:hypothetical protein